MNPYPRLNEFQELQECVIQHEEWRREKVGWTWNQAESPMVLARALKFVLVL